MFLKLEPCKSILKSPAAWVCFGTLSTILLSSSNDIAKLPLGGRYNVSIVSGLSPLSVTHKVSRFSDTCESLSFTVAFNELWIQRATPDILECTQIVDTNYSFLNKHLSQLVQ